MTDSNKNWEKEFDATFKLDNYGESVAVQNKVKQFISNTIATAVREERERMLVFLSSDDMTISDGIHTDGADITEAPVEMFAEMSGVRKGFEAAKSLIRSFLSPKK